MNVTKLGLVEARFADIVWDNAPLPSGELVKLCERELSWKRTTTYTVLKKLCERGLFANTDGTVTVKMSKAAYEAAQSEQFVEETFGGSLPAFLAAFTRRKALTDAEIDEIRRMIDDARKEK